MNYELAKKLKDAWFPQPQGDDGGESLTGYGADGDEVQYDNCCGFWRGSIVAYAPTLSELIAACGDRQVVIWKYESLWYAGIYTYGSEIYIDDYPMSVNDGSTPLKAVANLWLALNEKK